MYTLIRQPGGGELGRAFDALDEAFGTEAFNRSAAKQVLTEHGFNGNTLDTLIAEDCIDDNEE